MIQNLKAFAAICLALVFGTAAATLVPGCQPSRPSRPSSPTTSATTDAPEISIPKEEIKDEKPAEEKPVEKSAEEKPAEKSVEEKPAEKPAEKASEAKPAEKAAEVKPVEKPAEEKPAEPKSDEPKAKDGDSAATSAGKPGEWNQWGGSAQRNHVAVGDHIPTEWDPGQFDRKTGAWKPDTAKNIKWVSPLGSQTYGNTVVADGKIWLGTNNSNGYLARYPADFDLGVLVCFNEADGKFLWQHSSEKLPTGRVHDWPLQGICCSPLVEGDRLWFVTSRGEVRCLDSDGFYDGTDDGRPETEEPARLFDVRRADDPADDKVGGYVTELDSGKLPADLREQFASAGMKLPEGDIAVKADGKAKAPAKRWTFQAKVDGAGRDFYLALGGPLLSAFKYITPADKHEADVIWAYNMMDELGTSQHNMCSCSVTALGDILFVNTSNGVDEAHITIPAPQAPSFMAMNKNTGEVYWTDNAPGKNILHGQWSSPTIATIGGQAQVIFGGGDGWVYSFKANKGKDGKPELLWKFDINPKDAVLELGGRGTRNDIISTPVVYDNKVYFCTGQDPEHGEGVGILWCIDPTKRGDISEKLAVNRGDSKKPIPVKRIQAVVEADGDLAIDNPNSGVVWKYTSYDADGNGKLDFEEQFHRSISTVAIKDDLLFVPDFSGLFHCVDAQTGKPYWNFDMLAAAWGSALIVDGKVYVGDEDGDITVFNLSKEKHDPIAEINMGNSVYSTPVVAHNVLYIANKDHIFAIAEGAEPKTATTGGE